MILSLFRPDVQVVDRPHPMDIGVALLLKKQHGCYMAARYLRKFGWSVDAARCILLAKGTNRQAS